MTDKQMVEALLAWLVARGVGLYRTDGSVYAEGETGLFYGTVGSEPHRAVGLRRYDGSDAGQRRDAVKFRRVQAWCRAETEGDLDDLAAAVHDALTSLSRHAGINNVGHLSGPAPLGTDATGRPELSLNYTVTLED